MEIAGPDVSSSKFLESDPESPTLSVCEAVIDLRPSGAVRLTVAEKVPDVHGVVIGRSISPLSVTESPGSQLPDSCMEVLCLLLAEGEVMLTTGAVVSLIKVLSS